jgi:hypothetical protein
MSNRPISVIVKNKEWITVREKLIGNWKERPNWCVDQLRKYLGNFSTTDIDKLRTVLNYLTGSGFRSGKISSRDNPSIPKLRAEISAELKKRKFKHEQLQSSLFTRVS